MDEVARVCQCGSYRVFYWTTAKEYICGECHSLYPLTREALIGARDKREESMKDEYPHKIQFRKKHDK